MTRLAVVIVPTEDSVHLLNKVVKWVGPAMRLGLSIRQLADGLQKKLYVMLLLLDGLDVVGVCIVRVSEENEKRVLEVSVVAKRPGCKVDIITWLCVCGLNSICRGLNCYKWRAHLRTGFERYYRKLHKSCKINKVAFVVEKVLEY